MRRYSFWLLWKKSVMGGDDYGDNGVKPAAIRLDLFPERFMTGKNQDVPQDVPQGPGEREGQQGPGEAIEEKPESIVGVLVLRLSAPG